MVKPLITDSSDTDEENTVHPSVVMGKHGNRSKKSKLLKGEKPIHFLAKLYGNKNLFKFTSLDPKSDTKAVEPVEMGEVDKLIMEAYGGIGGLQELNRHMVMGKVEDSQDLFNNHMRLVQEHRKEEK